MVPGLGPDALTLAPAECCAACATTRGCNVWVACAREQSCGRQCWLKWHENPRNAPVRGQGDGVPWAAGTLPKDIPPPTPAVEVLNATQVVRLSTQHGELRIRLRPEWHVPSVRYVQHVAQADVCTIKCVSTSNRALPAAPMPWLLACRTSKRPPSPRGSAAGAPSTARSRTSWCDAAFCRPTFRQSSAPHAAHCSAGAECGPPRRSFKGRCTRRSRRTNSRGRARQARRWRRATWLGRAASPGPTSSSP